MRTFDLTSDLHADFWVDPRHPESKQIKLFKQLYKSLIPAVSSKILVIAGDLGHYNHQNIIALKILRERYQDIILVSGNHDMYLVNHTTAKKYEHNSISRLNDMIESTRSMSGIHYLTGDVVELNDIRFGGTGMWYDNYYAKTFHYMSDKSIDNMWSDYMNDSRLILDVPNQFDRYAYFNQQKELMQSVFNIGCDVVVSHMAPTVDFFPLHYHNPESTFYQFDGREFISQMDTTGIWCYGHTHETRLDMDSLGRRFLCNPLGYPSNSFGYKDWVGRPFPEQRKFLTVNLDEPIKSYDQVFEDNT